VPVLERLGRYEIITELGKGEMGTVYKAIDPKLDRVVALKVMRLDPGDLETRDFRQRFHAEARSAGRLSHPNIVIIYDFGEIEELAYIAMEFLRGESLRSMLDRQRFSTRRAVRYAGQIAEGLAAAHSEGVVHRDIKPANVVRLPNGLLKITDFGIARLPASHLTLDGTLLGTPKYMSPEQVRSQRVDGRSDIFSVGVLLYEMLTATLPFGGASLGEVMHQIAHDRPIHPLRWNPSIPESVIRILAKCLAKDPEARYQSVADLARDLRIHKVMDVARDAEVDEVFLPVNPTASLQRSESPRAGDTVAANDARNAPSAFDQTVPMSTIEGDDTRPMSALGLSRPGMRFAVGAVVGSVCLLAVGATWLARHTAPNAPAPAITAPVVAPVTATVTPAPAAETVVKPITEDTGEPAAEAVLPVTPKVIRRGKPKSAPLPAPVADTSPNRIEALPAPTEAPRAQPIIAPDNKAARDAAFRKELERQQRCLTTNRCD
jgi:serine/threonine protein kinase